MPITFSVKTINRYVGGSYETTEDVGVMIVDGGIMLSGFFFERVK